MLASFLKSDLKNPIQRDASPNFQIQNGLLSLRSRWRSVRSLVHAKGRQIGSGPTEATCKALTVRLKGSGMRWDADNAEALMAWRL